jgi:hypothetical protein
MLKLSFTTRYHLGYCWASVKGQPNAWDLQVGDDLLGSVVKVKDVWNATVKFKGETLSEFKGRKTFDIVAKEVEEVLIQLAQRF